MQLQFTRTVAVFYYWTKVRRKEVDIVEEQFSHHLQFITDCGLYIINNYTTGGGRHETPENVIEFFSDEDKATVSLNKKKSVSRVLRLCKSHPDDVEIVARNRDGSLCAKLPVDWIKFNPGKRKA